MNNILLGFIILLLFLTGGTLLNYFFIPIIPGSVIGMILLFIALQLKIVKEEHLKGVVEFMIGNMSIFFLPAAAGIMVSMPLISADIGAISVTVLVTTVATLLSVGFVHQWLNRGKK